MTSPQREARTSTSASHPGGCWECHGEGIYMDEDESERYCGRCNGTGTVTETSHPGGCSR